MFWTWHKSISNYKVLQGLNFLQEPKNIIYKLKYANVPYNIKHFDFGPYKNVFLVSILANIKYFILILSVLF